MNDVFDIAQGKVDTFLSFPALVDNNRWLILTQICMEHMGQLTIMLLAMNGILIVVCTRLLKSNG